MVWQVESLGDTDDAGLGALNEPSAVRGKRSIVRAVLSRPSASICLAVLALAFAFCFIGPFFVVDPIRVAFEALQPPSMAHPMGTDSLGRDLLARVLVGGRVSLMVGVAVSFLCLLIGLVAGCLAGYFGGFVDWVTMKLSEIFQVIPTIILGLVAVALWGQSMVMIIFLLAITMWPPVARIARIETMRVSQLGYVESARCAGFSRTHIILSDILPNILAPVVASTTITAGWAILFESGFSFLGLSSANAPSWGGLLSRARDHMDTAWWLSVFPGLAIVIVVVAINMLGEALNAALDPTIARVK